MLKTATPRDHQPPTTTNRQPPPTASGDQPPTANHCRPPPTTNHQPPTAANHHQPPITTSRQPLTANRHQPPTANRHQPWLNLGATRGLFAKLPFGNTFVFPLKDPPARDFLYYTPLRPVQSSVPRFGCRSVCRSPATHCRTPDALCCWMVRAGTAHVTPGQTGGRVGGGGPRGGALVVCFPRWPFWTRRRCVDPGRPPMPTFTWARARSASHPHRHARGTAPIPRPPRMARNPLHRVPGQMMPVQYPPPPPRRADSKNSLCTSSEGSGGPGRLRVVLGGSLRGVAQHSPFWRGGGVRSAPPPPPPARPVAPVFGGPGRRGLVNGAFGAVEGAGPARGLYHPPSAPQWARTLLQQQNGPSDPERHPMQHSGLNPGDAVDCAWPLCPHSPIRGCTPT